MKMLFRKALLAAGVSLFATGAMAEQGVTDTEVVFGNIVPLTHPVTASLAYQVIYGNTVAAAEWNEKGGINGRKIVIKDEDDAYVPANTVQALQKLIDEGVFAMLTTGAGAGVAATLPILEEQAIPTMVNFSPYEPAVNPVKPSIFMIGASYEDLLFGEIKYIVENKMDGKTPKIGVIRQDDDFGKQVETAFTRAIKDFGLDYADPLTFKRGQKDFGAEILKMRAAGVNILIAGGVTSEIPAMAKEAAKFKMDLQIATVPTGQLTPIVKLMQPTGFTYFSGDYVSPLGSKGAEHFEAMAKKHLTEEEFKGLSRYSLTAYAASLIMFQAAEACGKDLTRACISEKLASGEKFETNGVTQPISFSADKHIAATATLVVEIDSKTGASKAVTELMDF